MKSLLFIFLFCITLVFGQNNENELMDKKADSLEKLKKFDESAVIWNELKKNENNTNHNYYSGRFLYATGYVEAHQKGNYNQAISIFNQAESFFLKCPDRKTIKKWLSNTYLELSYCYWDWEEALKINKKGYDYTLKNLPNDYNIVSFLVDQGDIYRRLRNYELSIISLEKALKKINTLTPNDFEQLAYTHNLLGISYSDLHIHNQSIYHYTKGLEYHIKANSSDKAYLVNSMNNVIWENLDYGDEKKAKEILSQLNKNFYKWYNHKDFATTDAGSFRDYNLHFRALKYLANLRCNVLDDKMDQAKKYLDSISQVFDRYPEERKKIDNTLLLGRYGFEKLYASVSEKDVLKTGEHINFNQRTLEIARFSESKHDELVASLQLANAYFKYKKYNEALKTIEESKKIDEKFFNGSRFSVQILEATIFNVLQKPNECKNILLKSFEKLLSKPKMLKSLKSMDYNDFKKFNSAVFIRNILNSADLYFAVYQKSQSKEDLLVANNLYFIASDMFAEFYQKGKYNNSLKLFNQEIASGLLNTQLLIDPNDKSKIKRILNRIENNSSQHLWNVFEIKNSQNLKVPPPLIRNLNELVFEKNAIEQQLELSKDDQELKNKLADLDKNIAKIKVAINEKDQSYETFKSGNFSIENIQKKLTNKQLMIKYVVTDKNVYAFAIQNASIELLHLGETASIKKIVNQQVKQINSIDGNYVKTAKLLYEKIVSSILENHSVQAIVFVPEDFLNGVSFESLTNKKGQLLVQNYHTSYAYSIKLWDILQTNKKRVNDLSRFVSFAPNYTKIPNDNQMRGLRRADLFDLAEAKKEAQKISDLFEGKLYLNEEANRKNFLQATTDFSFHHLAMHSLLEEDYAKSSLVFSNNQKVLFDELYQLNFPSQLVVLSACNTGIGSMESGEGMMSLSRALTYSGVKSSVYSLWQVPDKETSEIMIAFYENLKEGQSKDEALANAKRDFIQNNPMKNHPFYWAGFVVNGDVLPIQESTNWWLYIGIGLTVGLLIFLFRKKLF